MFIFKNGQIGTKYEYSDKLIISNILYKYHNAQRTIFRGRLLFLALIANQILIDILKRRRVRALFKQFKNPWI